MKPLSGKEFVRLLERNGWSLRRINGSHHIYGKDGIEVRISVPIHGNANLKIGLQQHLSKLAGSVEIFHHHFAHTPSAEQLTHPARVGNDIELSYTVNSVYR